MLLSMPDLYAQLAETLQRLFADFGIAAWRLQRRQRLQFAGMVHHHMAHWNRGAGRLAAAVAAAAGRHGRQPSRGGGESSSIGGDSGAGAEAASSSDGQPRLRRSQLKAKVGGSHWQHGRGPASAGAGHLLSTSHVLDRGVYQGLVRVQAALETLSLQVRGCRAHASGVCLLCFAAGVPCARPAPPAHSPARHTTPLLQEEGTEEWEAAVGQLQDAIDSLGETTGREEGDDGAREQLEAAA